MDAHRFVSVSAHTCACEPRMNITLHNTDANARVRRTSGGGISGDCAGFRHGSLVSAMFVVSDAGTIQLMCKQGIAFGVFFSTDVRKIQSVIFGENKI